VTLLCALACLIPPPFVYLLFTHWEITLVLFAHLFNALTCPHHILSQFSPQDSQLTLRLSLSFAQNSSFSGRILFFSEAILRLDKGLPALFLNHRRNCLFCNWLIQFIFQFSFLIYFPLRDFRFRLITRGENTIVLWGLGWSLIDNARRWTRKFFQQKLELTEI